MVRTFFVLRVTLVLACLAALPISQAAAQSVESFYRGKTVTIIVAASLGGAYGAHARLLSRYMPKYLPGKPDFVVKDMPGAGGIKAANYMYNVAPKDGTVVLLPLSGIMLAQLLRPKRVKFDAAKFNWLGSIATITDTLSVRKDAPATTLDKVKNTKVIIGASGKGSQIYQEPALAKKLLGLKFDIVLGYKGGRQVMAAMDRNEVHGRVLAYTSWAMQRPEWVRDGFLVHLLQVGPKIKALGNVPSMMDLVKTDRERAMVEMLHISPRTGWAALVPPNVPSDRVAALRQAFAATMKDPAYIRDVKQKVNVDVEPTSGRDLQAYAVKTIRTPKSVISDLQAAIQ